MTTNTDPVKDAVDAERVRCLNIILDEYRYWRAVHEEPILDFATGAMGAAANILARIADLNMLPRQEPPRTKTA